MIDVTVEHGRRLIRVQATREACAVDHLRPLRALLEANPALPGYDNRYDMRAYAGGIGHDELAAHAALLRRCFPDSPGGGFSLVASPDAGIRFRVRLLKVQVPHRRVECLATTAEAERLLAEIAAARLAAQPPAQSPPPISQA